MTSLEILCDQLPPQEALTEARAYLRLNPSVEDVWVRVEDDYDLQLGWTMVSGRMYCVDLPLRGCVVAMYRRE